jgi:transposase-like protein
MKVTDLLRETAAILELVGVERTHGAVWSWVHRLADSVGDPPSTASTRVAADETAVRISGRLSWVYAAINLETKMLLDVAVFGR